MKTADRSGSSSTSPLRVVGIEAEPESRIDDVIALGDKHSKTLGHLPFSGFQESAHQGQIVVAIDPTSAGSPALAGYCLYYLPKRADRFARIVHLCVAEEFRSRGVARLLIAAVRERCINWPGLRLRCRDDWDANEVWPSLGFEPVRQLPGRSRNGSRLTEWWSPNETPNLFSFPADDAGQLLVAVDTNVFCDLYGLPRDEPQPFSAGVAVLAASQQIRLARPCSVTEELYRTPDDDERNRLIQAAASSMDVLGRKAPEVPSITKSLLASVPADALAKDPSLETDAKLLAESIAGSADVFVTRDENAQKHLGPPALEHHGVLVLDPAELQSHVEQRVDAAAYLPVQLRQTEYQVSRGDSAAWRVEDIIHLLDNEGGERKTDFRHLVKRVAVEVGSSRSERQIMLTPSGNVLAAWATTVTERVLEVPLLRVDRGQLASTITRQIAIALRQQAASAGIHTVAVRDTHCPRGVRDVLRTEGFKSAPDTGDLRATALPIVSVWREVQSAAKAANAISPQATWAALPPTRAEAAEYERVWWPAKITDADLFTFIVPIRGVFADDLLGHSATLWAREADLGLSREHVYYRSGRSPLSGPGRILWYSSSRDRAVVACSRLTESIIGSPEALHHAFAHLGVWNLPQVRESADKRGRVNALRFADNEIFRHPVGLEQVRALTGLGARLTLQSPVRIDGRQFARLYEEGVGT